MAERKNLVLAAMIFAVAMTFIDQTIVAIAAPDIQNELSLTSTGLQWVINGYLLSLAAFFALGGRLADVMGHRRMLVLGVVLFAGSSTLCGLTPSTDIAETWIISFRVLQGFGAALMYPAALAIVVSSFPLQQRGKALAIFFGIAGGLTAVGPFAGGYLTEWTWRSIFWINVPVAIIALVLTAMAKPADEQVDQPIDWTGAALIALGMGLSVFGLQQSSVWGWGDPVTIGCIVAGLAVIVGFVRFELRQEWPLIQLRIFTNRSFAAENGVLFLANAVFVPVFFFASMYAQIALGWSSSEAGLYLLLFFAGFAPASQVGGRILDNHGAKRAVVLGCFVAAVGFLVWGIRADQLSENAQWVWIVVSGAGMGLMFSPANTDAVNRAPRTSYGEATGITQTVRNYGASLGLAVMGTVLLLVNRSNLEDSLAKFDIPKSAADGIAESLSGSGGDDQSHFASETGHEAKEIFEAVQVDFAQSTRIIWWIMAGIMATAGVLALLLLPAGKQEAIVEDEPAPS